MRTQDDQEELEPTIIKELTTQKRTIIVQNGGVTRETLEERKIRVETTRPPQRDDRA